jgi:hypothetical protein
MPTYVPPLRWTTAALVVLSLTGLTTTSNHPRQPREGDDRVLRFPTR